MHNSSLVTRNLQPGTVEYLVNNCPCIAYYVYVIESRSHIFGDFHFYLYRGTANSAK